MSRVEKRAVMIVRLVPTPEAYEGKTNVDIEKEILEEKPAIPYVVHIDRAVMFNSIAGEPDAAQLRDLVIEEFKPVHKALGEAMGRLAERGVQTKTHFNAKEGFLLVFLEKGELGGF